MHAKFFLNFVAFFFLLFSSMSAQAALVCEQWYNGVGTVTQCGANAKIVVVAPENNGNSSEICLTNNGVNVNPTNAVITAANFAFEQGGGSVYGIRHKAEGNPYTLYFIAGANGAKDTISSASPSADGVSVTASNYQNMSLSTIPSFSADFCSLTGATAPTGMTYQWQSKAIDGSWTDIAGATSSDYTPANSVPDSTSFRALLISTTGTDSFISAAVMATYMLPSFSFSVDSAYSFNNDYEYEINNGDTFSVKVGPASLIKPISSYTIKVRKNHDEAFVDFMSQAAPDSVFIITPDSNQEYKVFITGSDLRPGHAGQSVTLSDSFFVRIRHFWIADVDSVVIWKDDFGHFTSATSFVWNNTTFSGSIKDVNGLTNNIISYWASDYNASVRNHDFALTDPLVGPYSGNCGTDGYKHYNCWEGCDGYRVEDGYYAILPNPNYSNCGKAVSDYWTGDDHTAGDADGGMLFVNCKAGSEHTVIYERSITLPLACNNTKLLFTAYINNATSISTNSPVNVLLNVYDENDKLVFSVPSGNIYPRTNGGYWANLSFEFTASTGGTYKLQLQNNQAGGNTSAGNDFLIDDISISYAFPNVELYYSRKFNTAAPDSPIDRCNTGDVLFYALNKNDLKTYITAPYFLYQYSKDNITWNSVNDISENDSLVISLSKDTSSLYNRFWGKTYVRCVVASSKDVLQRLAAGETIERDCDNLYAYSGVATVTFDYDGPMGNDTTFTMCSDSVVTLKGLFNNRPVYRWVDAKQNVLSSMKDEFSFHPTEAEFGDTLFYFVGESRLGCTDTQKVNIHVRQHVPFSLPDKDFVQCLFATPISAITSTLRSEPAFAWSINGVADASQTTKDFLIPTTSPLKGVVSVIFSANDYCSSYDSINYDIHKNIGIHLSAADRADSLFCLTPAADNKITFTAVTDSGAPIKYQWYVDGTLSGSTDAPTNSYSFPISSGKHVFTAYAADEVCQKMASTPAIAADYSVEAREPLSIALAPISDICEGASANAKATLTNVLTNPAKISWSVTAGSATLDAAATLTDASSTSSNKVTPSSSSSRLEVLTIKATAADSVCLSNTDVSASTSISLHKKISISLAAPELTNNQICIAKAGDEKVDLEVTVLRGNPTSYTWSDKLTSADSSRSYSLVVGNNAISVVASDGVCAADTASLDIKAREPLKVTLALTSGKNPVCIGETVKLNATVTSTEAAEQVVYTFTPASLGTVTAPAGSQSVSYNPVIGSNWIKVSVVEAVNPVCPAQSDSFEVNVQDSVRLSLEQEATQLCQNPDTSATVKLTATVLNGEPTSLVWSTGEETKAPGSIEVNPSASTTYTVYAKDEVCANSSVVSFDPIQVDQRFDVRILAQYNEVQIDSLARLSAVVANSAYAGSYVWTKDGVTIATTSVKNYEELMSEAGSFAFAVSVDEGICGLVSSDTVIITVADYEKVPTAFTPGYGNGRNEVFMKGRHVEIFNRYQQSVYEGNDGWNGKYQGSDAPAGTYFYRLYKKDGRCLKGTIELIKDL